jgi:hypothetical protein
MGYRRKKGQWQEILVWFVAALWLLAFVPQGSAQQIRATVKITLERLSLDKQQKLNNFSDDIEQYLSDYDWTGEVLDQAIPVGIQIFLMDNSVGYEDRYSGTFLVTNNQDLQYFDKYWKFPYQAGDKLVHNENAYHPLTGFLDFYICLILGAEYDKMGKLLGTPQYEKARLIGDQAKFNSVYILGWEERGDYIESILSDANTPFRTMKDLFCLALAYKDSEDSTSQKYGLQALSLLETVFSNNPNNMNNQEVTQFLDAHRQEWIDIFLQDPKTLVRMMNLDKDHQDIYKTYLNR